MLSPVLLILFSKPLRKEFLKIYWKKKKLHVTSNNPTKTNNSTKTYAQKISPSIQVTRAGIDRF